MAQPFESTQGTPVGPVSVSVPPPREILTPGHSPFTTVVPAGGESGSAIVNPAWRAWVRTAAKSALFSITRESIAVPFNHSSADGSRQALGHRIGVWFANMSASYLKGYRYTAAGSGST